MDLLIQIALFVLLGVLLYYIDSAILTGLYRVVYNMTHRDPLDQSVRKGFLMNRNARVRLTWAMGITAVVAIITLLFGNFFSDSTRVVLNLLAMLVGLSGGLVLAPILIKTMPGKLNQAVDYADQKEMELKRASSEERIQRESPADQPSTQQGGASQTASEQWETPEVDYSIKTRAQPDDAAEISKDVPNQESPKVSTSDPEKPLDWRKGVDDFLNK
jgi:hypothetical protein